MSSGPKIAVIGFGAAGIGFTQALLHPQHFSTTQSIRPKITVYEAGADLGGKIAPRNLGAQFLDQKNFYPIDRIVSDLKIKLKKPRPDYDEAPFTLKSGKIMEANDFLQAVQDLRKLSKEALKNQSWQKLDSFGGVGFLNQLNRAGQLSDEECEAMTCRLKFEEGTTQISALSMAINMAKGVSPVKRVEIVGGLHRLVQAAASALIDEGATILTNKRVKRISVLGDGVHIYTNPQESPHVFDYALLAASPEQYKAIQIEGSQFPHALFPHMKPARITKSNLWTESKLSTPEIAAQTHAMWRSQLETYGKPKTNGFTFFHGWEGIQALRPAQLRAAAGIANATEGILEQKTWDGRTFNGELPASYTTIPLRNQGYPTVCTIKEYLIDGAFTNERLLFANHVLGAGCYTRDGALAGEWAAIWLLKALGADIAPAFKNRPHPTRDFFGVDAIKA